jgi:hypothetical protein
VSFYVSYVGLCVRIVALLLTTKANIIGIAVVRIALLLIVVDKTFTVIVTATVTVCMRIQMCTRRAENMIGPGQIDLTPAFISGFEMQHFVL